MMRRSGRPKQVIVNFDGIDYEMDLTVCRQARVRRQVDGDFESMEQLADSVGLSRSTISRFFAGRQMSLKVALAVLDTLKLTFDEVFTQCHPDVVGTRDSSGRLVPVSQHPS